MKTKLRQSKGETLVETLVALAIVVLAIFLLTNMLTVAARLNHKSANLTDSFQQEMAIAEGGLDFVASVDFRNRAGIYGDFFEQDFVTAVQNTRTEEGTVEIAWREALDNYSVTVKVDFFGSGLGNLAYYQVEPPEDPQENPPENPLENGGD